MKKIIFFLLAVSLVLIAEAQAPWGPRSKVVTDTI